MYEVAVGEDAGELLMNDLVHCTSVFAFVHK